MYLYYLRPPTIPVFNKLKLKLKLDGGNVGRVQPQPQTPGPEIHTYFLPSASKFQSLLESIGQ